MMVLLRVFKMKKIYTILIGILLTACVTASLVGISKPNIITDLTEEEKINFESKFPCLPEDKNCVRGYQINSCWWEKECYFCDLSIVGFKQDKRAITCNFEQDKKIWEAKCTPNELGDKECEDVVVGEYTMQELAEKKVIKIVKAHTKEKDRKEDDENLKGINKKWRK